MPSKVHYLNFDPDDFPYTPSLSELDPFELRKFSYEEDPPYTPSLKEMPISFQIVFEVEGGAPRTRNALIRCMVEKGINGKSVAMQFHDLLNVGVLKYEGKGRDQRVVLGPMHGQDRNRLLRDYRKEKRDTKKKVVAKPVRRSVVDLVAPDLRAAFRQEMAALDALAADIKKRFGLN